MKLKDILPLIENEYFCIMGARDIYTTTIFPKSYHRSEEEYLMHIKHFLETNVIRIYAEKDNSIPVYLARVCVVIDDTNIR